MTHPHHQYRRHKVFTTTAAVLTCLTLGLAGCSNNTEPDPIPEGNETTSPTTGETTEPTPTTPSWEDKYTKQELQAYEAALDRWTQFQTKSEPIYAKGKATPEAKKLFSEYYPSPVDQILFNQLETYEQVEVKSSGIPEVLWTRPTRIVMDGKQGSVVFEQCVDYTTVETTQWGKPVEQAKRFKKPLIRKLSLSQPEGYPWLIYESNPPPKKGFKHCTEEEGQ